MLDLSEDPLEENIATCVEYLERMSKSNLLLEMELGVTGGEEDGVDNSDVDSSKLYTQPEEVYEVYKALKAVPNGMFTVAAAFGNVHGVYAPGNVKLTPQILHNTQAYISEKEEGVGAKPVSFVFHGGSGSSREDIRYAIEAGTIKMNIDTDTQWSFWDGIRQYEAANHDYLQGQIGNPEGETKPNKKYYDPRMALRAGEESMAKRLGEAMEDLNCTLLHRLQRTHAQTHKRTKHIISPRFCAPLASRRHQRALNALSNPVWMLLVTCSVVVLSAGSLMRHLLCFEWLDSPLKASKRAIRLEQRTCARF